jgi:hypothetical protein
MVASDSNPRVSARRAHSAMLPPATPAMWFGNPIPSFMMSSIGRLSESGQGSASKRQKSAAKASDA